MVKWVVKTPSVWLKNVMPGQAFVYDESGNLLGSVLKTEAGTWWSMVPHGDGFDILDDHRIRRDAVERISERT